MKFLIAFVLALATTTAFTLRDTEITSRSIVMPVEGTEGRITNGQAAAVGQFPYQVGLLIYAALNSFCGGSLISNQWVLTAAHCTDKAQSVDVLLGSTVLMSAEVVHKVVANNIIIHSGWDRRRVVNDISLIKIPPVTYSDKIQKVNLPFGSYSTYVNDIGIASGWGKKSDNASQVSTNLQYGLMPIISNSQCANTFRNIPSTQICTVSGDRVSTCNGDSGGPMILKNSMTLIGVTSYGTEYCEKSNPAVFTRVTSYLDWIVANTGISN